MRLSQRERAGLQVMWAWLLLMSGCFWWAKRQLRRRGAVLVLTFHRVLDQTGYRHTSSLPAIVIRRRTFAKLAAHVARKYEAVSFGQAAESAPGKIRVMFTFDDGWEDTYTNALPVMRARGLPATLFVCPGLIERTLPFWPEVVSALLARAPSPVNRAETESVIEMLKTYSTEQREQFIARLYEKHAEAYGTGIYDGDKTVSWQDIREMAAAGVSVGCHTNTHQILTIVPPETARREIRDSKRAIESALGQPCDLFAYPNGNTSPETRRMLADEGFAAAFTTERGAWTSECDRMAIPRLNISEASVAGLSGRFSPAMFQYNVVWKAWRAMQSERRLPVKPRPEPVLSGA